MSFLPALLSGVLGSGIVPKLVDAVAPALKGILPGQIVDTGANLLRGVAQTFSSLPEPSHQGARPERGSFEGHEPPPPSLAYVSSKMESPLHVSTLQTTPAGRMVLPSALNAANARTVILPNLAQMRVAKRLAAPRRGAVAKKGQKMKRRMRRYF